MQNKKKINFIKNLLATVLLVAIGGWMLPANTISVMAADLNVQDVEFAKGTSAKEITYGETYQNKATANTTITYSSSNTSIATVNSSGLVTPLKAGTVTITATAKETDEYAEATAEYELTINKATQSITFAKGDTPSVEINTNGNEYSNKATSSATNTKNNVLTYEVISGSTLVEDFDTSDGSFTIKNTGNVKIKATFSGNSCYEEASKTYTLTINEWSATDCYVISGDSPAVNGWFNSDVSIKAKTGYSVSSDKTVWTSLMEDVVTADTTGTSKSFYIKDNTSGHISKKITETIKVDSLNPTGSIKTANITVWDKFLTFIGLGSDSLEFTIEADDSGSGIDSIKYYIVENDTVIKSKDDLDNVSNWSTYSGNAFSVSKNKVCVVYAKITDKAGNYIYTSTNGIVFDSTKPTITFINKTPDYNGVFGKDLTIDIQARDIEPYSGLKSVDYEVYCNTVKVQGEEIFTSSMDNPTYSGLEYEYSQEITVNSELTDGDVVLLKAKVVDYSGNEFVKEGSYTIDASAPIVQPSIKSGQAATTVFSSNVDIDLLVTEPTNGGVFTGINEIRYEIYNRGTKTQEGSLYKYNSGAGTPICEWSTDENNYITVDKDKNNSNSVVVKIIAVDNGGNETETSMNLKIDTTAPKISVTYDNNSGLTSSNGKVYFNTGRTAKIVIEDSNFDASRVNLSMSGGAALSGWSSVASNENGDDGVHTATVSFMSDGEYTFGISCSDLAGNSCTSPNYNGTATTSFVVDKTAPEVTIAYDNNEAMGGSYYQQSRIATIRVQERNFDASKAQLTVTAKNAGQDIELPTISNWVSEGDIHTATIVYDRDAVYTFDFVCQDRAGNSSADIPEEAFCVDKTPPTVSITKIVDESANNIDGDIGFVISASDTNFDTFTPVITVVVRDGDKFVTKQVTDGGVSNIANGQMYVVRNLKEDGIYRISCTVVDKAGNQFTEVILQNPDGTTYVEERAGEDTLVTFSVNREGSTFELEDNTESLVNQFYVQAVNEDVVVVEINANVLKEYSVSLNGKELVENTDYTVKSEGGYGEWKKYTYYIKKTLFEAEGEYKVVISSTDEATNNAFSDVKDATVSFVVDRTAPVISVSGMENKGRYRIDKQTVTIIPTDDGGALSSLLVCTVDENGNELVRLIDLAGEELQKILDENEGKISFSIEEGLYQNIRIICKDCAVDSEGNTNTYDVTFYDVSVSSSALKIMFAGTGAKVAAAVLGVVLVGGGVGFFGFRRKRLKR